MSWSISVNLLLKHSFGHQINHSMHNGMIILKKPFNFHFKFMHYLRFHLASFLLQLKEQPGYAVCYRAVETVVKSWVGEKLVGVF